MKKKIDMDGALEVNDILQPQLPWSIKRLILWWVLFLLIIVVVVASFGFLMAHFNHVNRWGLTIQDIGLISQTYLYLIFVFFFFLFLHWQCKKVGLSIRTIWGAICHTTQVRYIIFAFVFGAIMSILEAKIAVNFGNPATDSSDVIFLGQIIVIGLLCPFQEELYFRGLLYRTLRKRNDIIISNLISAFIFLFFHVWGVDLTGLLFIFFYGVVTAFLVERTNSLTASFVCHAIGNLVPIVIFQHKEFF